MTEQEKMTAGMLYRSDHPALLAQRRRAQRLTRLFCQTTEEEEQERDRILRELLGAVGKTIRIEPPFRCDYGSNISVGDNFFANFDCIILDICPVKIGKNVMFGPKVCLYAATHPLDAGVRATGLELGRPITIGDDVWIGGNVAISPGVTIGSGTVIGAGAVVTKDIPSNVLAAGNPCRVVRPITEEDREKWERLAAEYREG